MGIIKRGRECDIEREKGVYDQPVCQNILMRWEDLMMT